MHSMSEHSEGFHWILGRFLILVLDAIGTGRQVLMLPGSHLHLYFILGTFKKYYNIFSSVAPAVPPYVSLALRDCSPHLSTPSVSLCLSHIQAELSLTSAMLLF